MLSGGVRIIKRFKIKLLGGGTEETCIVCKGKVHELFGSLLLGATLTCPNCKSLYHYNCSPKKGLVFKKPVCLICNDVELVK